ncbi:MAG: hypothetical protein E7424_06565 [Ruminococcaceae bacterium]|nr:hypothetical protein [Oscillospiraceae bacterium]
MKKRILSLGLCLCLIVSLLPAGVLAAEAGEDGSCRALSEAWFGDHPAAELRLPADLVPKKSAQSASALLDDYFDAREKCWTGRGGLPRKGTGQPGADVSLSEAVAAFEARAGLKITDARITTLYDQTHILERADGSYTVFVYEWVFFDYDDLSDGVQTTDVSGCGVSHKIVLAPAEGGFEIASDEYDASDFLGICTLNDSTKSELEQMHWTPAETDDEDTGLPMQAQENGPARKGLFYSRYSPDAAAAYADKYVYNKAQGGTVYENYYNKAYANYNSVGGDCANYTSQSISAGGMPQVKGTPYGTDGWYYAGAHDRSGTWTYVPYLRDWMAANRGVKRAASNSTVWKGSPVFYGDQHAVICVGWNSAGVPVINSHNNDWYHVKWNYYDPGNVTTVQLTPGPGPDPHPGKPVLTDFRRSWASGQSVVFRWEDTYYATHYNLYIDAMRPDGTWERCSQIRNYAQSGQTLRLPDGVYRVMLQAVNAEDADWPYTNGDSVRFVVGSHTHSRGAFVRFEKQHPHPACYRCDDCGEIWTDVGASNEIESCPVCQQPGKPVLHSPQGEYAEYEPIPFRWDPVPKATQCGLHIDRQDPDGSWQADYLVEQPAESGCTERLEAGTYRVLLRAENAKCAGEDGTGRISSDSEPVAFTVSPKVQITFDPAGGSFADACGAETVDRIDAPAGEETLAVYTRDGEAVESDAAVAVDANGLVVDKQTAGGAEEAIIVPFGGFVLSAGGDGHGAKAEFVSGIAPGDFVAFDREGMTVNHYTDADAYLSQHKQILPGSVYGSLPAPEREGFYFNGWLDASGQPVGGDTAFSSALLTAAWADDDTEPAERIDFAGHSYARYEYGLSWHDAERFCEERGGHLAAITSFEEQAAVESLAGNGRNAAYFIGCSDESAQDQWIWVSGEDFSAYGNWASGRPESVDGGGFGAMVRGPAAPPTQFGEWLSVPDAPSYPSDSLCSYGFICEYDTPSQAPPEQHVHSFSATRIPPDCTKAGYTLRQCTCGQTVIDEVAQALGHDASAKVTEPTCTQPGFTAYVCTRCGDSRTGDETAALGHDYVNGACRRCGENDPDYVPLTDLSELEKEVAGAFRIRMDGFTPDSVSALDIALERAATAVSGSQDVVDAAARAVRDAVDALEPKPQILFRDVLDDTRFYYDPVYWALRASPRITNGVDPTHFGPDRPCTRAHVVTFLWRAAGCPEPGRAATGFKDLKAGSYYEKAVAWAVEKGITNGVSKTKFAPDDFCTRAQIVTFLWRFKGSGNAQSAAAQFADLKHGAYYERAVAWAVENRVTNGMSPGAFGPDAVCTRSQAVTFLCRAAEGK